MVKRWWFPSRIFSMWLLIGEMTRGGAESTRPIEQRSAFGWILQRDIDYAVRLYAG